MTQTHTLLQVAEDLYQAGFISYPRTETDSFSVNTDLHVSISGFDILKHLTICAKLYECVNIIKDLRHMNVMPFFVLSSIE